MTSKKFLLLAAAAVAALAIALLLSHQRSSSGAPVSDVLYPGLKDDLKSVTAVRIYKAGDARAIELVEKDGQWSVTDRANYPADAGKVRKLLLAIAEAKPVEEKTSNPENYAALGVEDVSATAATGSRVELEGTAKPVNLIVGKAAGVKGTYVRRAGEPASWLINESIGASTTVHDWLRASVVDVTADRVQSVSVTLDGKAPYTAAKSSRADADFKVEGLPKGKEADAFAVNGLASTLTGLTLADVAPAQEFASEKPSGKATVKTFDGLVVDFDGYAKDGKHYVAVKAAYDAALAERFHVATKAPDPAAGTKEEAAPATAAPTESVEASAKSTNDRLQGWVFEIPDYKYEAIFKPVDSLIKK